MEVSIPMGCAISPILFVLAMKVITKVAERSGPRIEFKEGEKLPPNIICAGIDNSTPLCARADAVMNILTKLGS